MKKRSKNLSWLMTFLLVLQLVVLPGTARAEAPAAPVDVRAITANDGSKVIITWSGQTSLKYNTYHGTDGNTFSKITAAPVEATFYDDLGVDPAVSHYYYVTSVNDQGEESTPSAVVIVNPSLIQPPTNLRAVVSGGQVSLSWNAPGGTAAAAGYNIYRQAGTGSYTKVNANLVTATGYTDTGLIHNTSYTYQVAAVDTSGHESPERVQTTVVIPADSQAPGKPGGLTAAASGLTRINLNWNAAADNFGVTEYVVYRSTDNRNYAVIARTVATNYADTTGLILNTRYYYKVSARDAAGNESVLSDAASAVLALDTQKPSAPHLAAVGESDTRIKLTWSGATDNIGVTGYDLYRTAGSGSYTKIASPGSSPYYDNSVSHGVVYSYYLNARDAAGNISAASNTVTVTTGSSAEKTIARGKSGYLEVPGLARLDVPSDALNRDTAFEMITGDFHDYSASGYKTVGQPVEITATAGSSAVTSFNSELTVTFYFNSTQLGGTDTGKLRIYFWDEDNDKWSPLTSNLYWSPQRVTAKTSHLTVFALMADTTAPDVPTLSNSTTTTIINVTLSGRAEAYADVEIKLNGKSFHTTASGGGKFAMEAVLETGTNYISLRAMDAAGNRSSWSNEYRIKYEPEIILHDINGHWAENDIQRAVELDIASGFSDKTFRPDRTVTRAEFCKFVVAALDLSPVSSPRPDFKDRQDIPAWAAGYVARAVEKGIVAGYSDGRFKPSREITREEMSSMLVRAMGLQREADAHGNTRLSFKDYRLIQDWSRGAVAVAVEQGMIKGYNDNSFGPARKATRAEAVTMIVKMLDQI